MRGAIAGVAELADARDLKSLGSDAVPVQAQSPAPKKQPYGCFFGAGDVIRFTRARTMRVFAFPRSGTIHSKGVFR